MHFSDHLLLDAPHDLLHSQSAALGWSQVREAQGIKDTDEDRRRDRNRKAMADAYDKSSMKARPALANTV